MFLILALNGGESSGAELGRVRHGKPQSEDVWTLWRKSNL